jgi:hypothetical protein
MSLSYVTLTGTIPGSGTASVQLRPSNWLTDPADELLIPPAPVSVYCNPVTNTFSVSLLATDNAAPTPSGWYWTVTISGIPGVGFETFSFFLPADPFSFTATDASPCVFTASGSSYADGTPVVLTGAGLPAGFTAGTNYYVVSASGDTFELAATSGGSPIRSTSTGSGTVATATTDISTVAQLSPVPDVLSYLPVPSGTPGAGQVPVATGTGQASDWATLTAADVGADAEGAAAAAQANAETYAAAQAAAAQSAADLDARYVAISVAAWVTVSPIGLTTSGVTVANNGAQFGPDTPGTTTCGIQEALNSLPACTVNQKSSFGGGYTISGQYGRLSLQSGIYQTSSLITVPAGQVTIDGSGRSSWIPPNVVGLTQELGGTVIACTSYSTGGMTVTADTNGNPATALDMHDLDIRMQSPASAQTTSTPAVLNLAGWKSGTVANINVIEAPSSPGSVGTNLYKIIDVSPAQQAKDITELRNVRGFGGNIGVTLSAAHLTAIGVTGGLTSQSISSSYGIGISAAGNLGCYFADLHAYICTYGLRYSSYQGIKYQPEVIYGFMFESVTHYILPGTAAQVGTLIIEKPCWNTANLNPASDIAATCPASLNIITKYEQDVTSDGTPAALHVTVAPSVWPAAPAIRLSAQTTSATSGSFGITAAIAGNLLVAIVGNGSNTPPVGTDNVSGTTGWTTSSTFANQSGTQATFLMYKVAGGGETHIGTTASDTSSYSYWEIENMGATPAVDAIVAVTNGSGITSLTGGALTTTSADDIVLTGMGGVSNLGTISAWTDSNAGVPTLVSAAGNCDGASYVPGAVQILPV